MNIKKIIENIKEFKKHIDKFFLYRKYEISYYMPTYSNIRFTQAEIDAIEFDNLLFINCDFSSVAFDRSIKNCVFYKSSKRRFSTDKVLEKIEIINNKYIGEYEN